MDYKAIEELIKTMNSSGLYSLEIESGGTKIKMKKGPDQIIAAPEYKEVGSVQSNRIEETAVSTEESKVQNTISETAQEIVPETAENLYVVTSPIVGTFYPASSPEAEPFVSVGSKVKKGDTLCIIEAMKLMNEIECEVDGEISEILVKDQDMVEFGQPMFKIKLG